MKICFLSCANSVHGYKWIKYFAEQGHEVHWIFLSPNMYEPIEHVTYHEIQQQFFFGVAFLKAVRKVKQLLKAIKPDVLHAHYAGTYGLVGALSGFHPLVLTAWGSDVLLCSKNIIKRPLIQFALNKADLITCDANHMKNAMENLGINREKIKLIYFGIDTKKFQPMEKTTILLDQFGVKQDDFVVISLRNLEPIYNIETLIKAVPDVLKMMPNVKFIIAGAGIEKEKLKQLAESLNVANSIIFIGKYSNDHVSHYLNASDVYVSTSLSDAGIAASTAEAMACGVPVVVTNSGENEQWIDHGKNGFIIPMRDSNQLAEKICFLLKNESLRKQIGIKGRDIIVHRNDYWNEMAKMENLYKSLVAC